MAACMSLVSMLSTYQVYIYQKRTFYIQNYWNEPVFYTSNFVLMLLVVSTLLGFRILKDRMHSQRLLEQIEKEKISTELDFLKAQINPHFLFNSLNNILFQIDRTNHDARQTLLQFSDMLRYQLYECSGERVEIEQEVRYLKNYIEMQMLRRNDRYGCNLVAGPGVYGFTIAPLLLIPFVENAFKHISNHSNAPNNIDIRMDYQGNEFTFEIRNDKDHINAIPVRENRGIGLANVQRRLELLYPGKYDLRIENESKYFRAFLKLNTN
jgi:two-component system, LytTR family, sensor kinase